MPQSELTEIPNIGPAVARKLERLDVHSAEDLRGRDPRPWWEFSRKRKSREHG